MINIKSLIAGEPVESVIISLIHQKGISFISLDRWYSEYDRSVIATGQLILTMRYLVETQVIIMDRQLRLTRGPNWKAPQFMLDKKYGFK